MRFISKSTVIERRDEADYAVFTEVIGLSLYF